MLNQVCVNRTSSVVRLVKKPLSSSFSQVMRSLARHVVHCSVCVPGVLGMLQMPYARNVLVPT